ncbi:MAG: hypothetical protein H0U27_05720 [Nitrosopumilus sp.]|nr:hypothetical protein [Nitrosopumilus sp.]
MSRSQRENILKYFQVDWIADYLQKLSFMLDLNQDYQTSNFNFYHRLTIKLYLAEMTKDVKELCGAM